MLLKKLLKEWTLLSAMFFGVLLAVLFDKIQFIATYKQQFDSFTGSIMPLFMFSMLFLSFTSISPKDLKFKGWHLSHVLFQVCCAVGFMFLFLPFNKEIAATLFVCFICPTAVASSVITDKLKGNVATLVSYILIINCVASIIIPLFLPFISITGYSDSFFSIVWRIMKKIFPLLVLPIASAWIIRFAWPALHEKLYNLRWISFYIWAVSLVFLIDNIVDAVFADGVVSLTEFSVMGFSLLSCVCQFGFGRLFGQKFDDKISGGQALGQKNTIFAIWLATTFVNPIVALAPGSYIIWQNIINSIELRNSKKQRF